MKLFDRLFFCIRTLKILCKFNPNGFEYPNCWEDGGMGGG